MNVKPGDIAVIVADDPHCPSPLAGLLVDVLYASPLGSFTLPDGFKARGDANAWVIRFQRPVEVRIDSGTRNAWYAGCPDEKLRPIRGEEVGETEVTSLYTPTEIKRAKESVE